MSFKILIVDDEPANLRLLERLFRSQYQVLCAASGLEALELLTQHDVAVIIADQRMPGMTGIEFLKRAAEMRQNTLRIIMTGYTDVNSLVEVINSGVVYKYVTKPWVNEDLQQTVTRALQHYETIKSRHELATQNERLTEQLRTTRQGVVRLIAETLDAKDEYAHGHARRATNYAVALAHRLNPELEELEELSLAVFLHEIGRTFSPDGILFKSIPLTDKEMEEVRRNEERGARMLGSIPGMAAIALAVRHQHENYDGSGYPEGLSGEQIPLHSRIIKVVDAYDQMTSPRPIQRAVTHEQAIEFLKLDAGKRFDPEIVNAFCELTAISEIRRSISGGLTGMQMIASRVFCDANNLSTPELLQKFKTEPILAFDLLKLSNLKGDNEPTIQLMSAMSRVGEAGLRLFIEQNGLPESVLENDDRLTRPQRCAVAAQLLAAHTNIVHPDDAYTLGLLYDIGEILLASLFPDEMLMLGQIDEELRAQRQIELFGVDQAQVSQWMLESCGVPREFTTAVKSHREILRINTPLALLMEVANNIASTKAPHNAAAMNSIPKDILEILNLSRGDLKRIYERTNAIAEGRLETNQDVYEYA